MAVEMRPYRVDIRATVMAESHADAVIAAQDAIQSDMAVIEFEAVYVALAEADRIWKCRQDPSHPLITAVDEPKCSVCGSRCEN